MSLNSTYYITQLHLQPHPEGGYYKEVYTSTEVIPQAALPKRFNGDRVYSTAIYFLIEDTNFSAFHRIASDEVWHFYDGNALEVIEIDERGEVQHTLLGRQLEQGQHLLHTVKAGRWFASRVLGGKGFSLVGCTVAPGFDFADFELANPAELTATYPQHRQLISELTRTHSNF